MSGISLDQVKAKLCEVTKTSNPDPEIVARCFEIATTLGLSVEDLGNRWEAYVINKKLESTIPNMKELLRFSDEIKAQQQNLARSRDGPETPKKRFQVAELSTDIFSDYGMSLPATDLFNSYRQENANKTPDRTAKAPSASPPAVKSAAGTPAHAPITPTKPFTPSTPGFKKPGAVSSPSKPSAKAPATPSVVVDDDPYADPAFDAAVMQIDSTPTSSQGSRTNRGKVEISFGSSGTSSSSQSSSDGFARSQHTVDLKVLTQVPQYRYMFDRLESKSLKLDNRVERLGTDALEAAALDRHGVLERASQELIHVVGRVCAESAEGSMNAASVVLADCAADGPKPRVLLELRDLDTFSLFPGQAIGVSGTNPTGKKLIVKQLHQPPPPSPAASDSSSKAAFGLSVLLAGGPFSYHEDLVYEAWADLVRVAEEKKPDLIVLLGPFLDSEHPQVKNCKIELPYEQFFEKIFAEMTSDLRALLGSHTRLVVQPSLRDVHHAYVFPQPPFTTKVKMEKNISLVSNPAVLRVDGVTIGVCSSPDVLQHLAAEEICRVAPPQTPSGSTPHQPHDRIAQLCEHVIRQQTFYPLNPPAVGANVDSTHLAAAELTELPDVLIFKSEMKPFVKVVCGVLCVNIGPLTRNNSNGFYTLLNIQPLTPSSSSSPSSSSPIAATTPKLPERTRVEIVKV